MSQSAPRCVLRIKVSVVGIIINKVGIRINKGLKPTTCKQSTNFPPGSARMVSFLPVSSQEYRRQPPDKKSTPVGLPRLLREASNAGRGQWINLNILPTKLTFYPDLQLYQIRILKSVSHNLPYPPPVQNMKRENCKYGNEDLARPARTEIQQKIIWKAHKKKRSM